MCVLKTATEQEIKTWLEKGHMPRVLLTEPLQYHVAAGDGQWPVSFYHSPANALHFGVFIFVRRISTAANLITIAFHHSILHVKPCIHH